MSGLRGQKVAGVQIGKQDRVQAAPAGVKWRFRSLPDGNAGLAARKRQAGDNDNDQKP